MLCGELIFMDPVKGGRKSDGSKCRILETEIHLKQALMLLGSINSKSPNPNNQDMLWKLEESRARRTHSKMEHTTKDEGKTRLREKKEQR